MNCGECHREAVDPVKPGPAWPWCCRACFVRVDAAAEALELTTSWRALAVGQPDPTALARPLKFYRPVQDLSGRRFGRLLVLRMELRERYGVVRREWLCRCDCARELLVTGSRLLRLGVQSCAACAAVARGLKRRTLSRSVDVHALAQASGLTVKGIRSRLHRGVPVELLGAPRAAEVGSQLSGPARQADVSIAVMWSRVTQGAPPRRRAAA